MIFVLDEMLQIQVLYNFQVIQLRSLIANEREQTPPFDFAQRPIIPTYPLLLIPYHSFSIDQSYTPIEI